MAQVPRSIRINADSAGDAEQVQLWADYVEMANGRFQIAVVLLHFHCAFPKFLIVYYLLLRIY